MAKAKAPSKTPGSSALPTADDAAPITVTWSLAELPSAQHRAGLAGLAMMVKYTKSFADFPADGVLSLDRLDDHGLDLSLNRTGLTALFDRVYKAGYEETEVAKPWVNKRTKQEVVPKLRRAKEVTDKKGNAKSVEVCVYDVVVPHGGPLGSWAPAEDGGRWLKLWRDWLWNTLRAIPKQRTPYNQRAAAGAAVEDDEADNSGEETGSKDVQIAWACLRNNPTVALASTYFLGAMDATTEAVPFQDSGRFLFLLHFWPFAIQLFVPRVITADGSHDHIGFATCIPDVMRLATFVRAHEQTLRKRTPAAARFLGYRPQAAIIDLAEASALEAERWLDQSLEQGLAGQSTRVVAGFQVVHAVKDGNSVRIRSNRTIVPERSAKDISAFVQEHLWSHLVRRQVLANALDQHPWWLGFERICATWGKGQTIKDSAFCHDARTLFTHFHPHAKDPLMNDPESPRAARDLPTLILHVVQTWVAGRLQAKHQLQWSDIASGKATKEQFEEKKGKLATEAFLAARSRPGRDFARWFTATLCSVNQRLSEEEFVALSTALEQQPEQVRSLTLLALSARG